MASLDLEDAYYLVPIHQDSKKYFRFEFKGVLYQFNCLVFGLCIAPYIFTKIMKPIMRILRIKNYSLVTYLDDILCVENSLDKCVENVNRTASLLESLGFSINQKKSSLVPQKKCKHLGFIIDSAKQITELTEEKRTSLGKLVDSFIHKQIYTIRDFSQFIGKLVGACPGVDYGWLYIKPFEPEKLIAVSENNNYKASFHLPEKLKPDLLWWNNSLQIGNNKFRLSTYSNTIFTDA